MTFARLRTSETGRVVSKRGGITLDRLLKRYIFVEGFLGIAVMILGALFGGVVLPALGACMIGFAAQCFACSDKHPWAVISLGLISLLTLTGTGISAFVQLTSISRYEGSTSPLTVLLVLAVVILVQNFLALPLEDRSDLDLLRRGISRMVAFSGIGFVGIVLTYLLSYLLYGLVLEGETVPDFHYLEGILALAMILTTARGVLLSFLKKKENIQDETT